MAHGADEPVYWTVHIYLYTTRSGPMRSWRNVSALMLSMALATACVASRPKQGINPDMLGSYRFEEQLTPDAKIEGTFVVGQDSVAIDAYPGPCRYERDRSNVLAIAYTCGGVSFAFDRADPVHKATYTAIVSVKGSRQVCVRYTTNKDGKQVCAQMSTETFYRDVRRSGALRPLRMDEVM